MKTRMTTPIISLLTIVLLVPVHWCLPASANNKDAIGYRVVQQKSYYFASTFKLNWHKAATFCRTQGLFLVSINSQTQLDEVREYVYKSGFFRSEKNLQMWTSGNDLGERNHFFWTSTGERFVFDRWSAGEPNHSKVNGCTVERCVVLQHYDMPDRISYSFDDRGCENEYYFLCESLHG